MHEAGDELADAEGGDERVDLELDHDETGHGARPAAQAAKATSRPTPAGSEVSSPSQLMMTSERPITAPIDRSKAPATSGTRKARARIAVTTPSLNTSRVVVAVRNWSLANENTTMNPSHR